MRPETLKIAATVKADPAIGTKHGEAVCVAGVDTGISGGSGCFPVPFRDMPFDRRFRKFDAIESTRGRRPIRGRRAISRT